MCHGLFDGGNKPCFDFWWITTLMEKYKRICIYQVQKPTRERLYATNIMKKMLVHLDVAKGHWKRFTSGSAPYFWTCRFVLLKGNNVHVNFLEDGCGTNKWEPKLEKTWSQDYPNLCINHVLVDNDEVNMQFDVSWHPKWEVRHFKLTQQW